MTRGFTGRHMLAIMIAFFGTVMAVNLVMATLATRTFGGTVVDNSYVASQRFNSWLDEARAQDALGWNETLVLDSERRLVVAIETNESPLAGATLKAVARHPVGRSADQRLAFEEIAPGRYRSRAALGAGRWNVHVEIREGERTKRLVESLS